MSEWMNTLLNLSLAASFAAAAVLPVRFFLRRAPKKYSYLLWAVVFWRAVCPVSFLSSVSLFRLLPFMGTRGNRLELTLENYQAARLAAVFVRVPGFGAPGGAAGQSPAGAGGAAAGAGGALYSSGAADIEWGKLCFFIWAAGIVLFLLYAGISWLRLCLRVTLAVRTEEGIYESDQIPTAFLLGVIRPRIYLPTGLSGRERLFVEEHERVHLKRHDHQIKMLAWLIVLIHWFNPLMWLSFCLLIRDMEMSCDEQVLKNLGGEGKEEYGEFLLALAAPKYIPSGNPLAFGEGSVKQRVRNILRYRKESWKMAAAVLALAGVWSFTCLANPAGREKPDIIGGADGPSSIFLSEDREIESSAMEFLREWAEAAGGRDADRAYEMLSPRLKEKAEELGIYTAENGERVMGWSSPFVTEEAPPVIVMSQDDGVIHAEITYPAMTSDPLWWVWKDYVELEKWDDTWQIAAWESRDFFAITSAKDFAEAYEAWTPAYRNSNASAEQESFASYLQEHYDSKGNPEYYGGFTSPLKAAEMTLHISGGEAVLEHRNYGDVWLTYRWPDGQARIHMVQPLREGEEGIWVPEELQWEMNGESEQ